MEVWPPITDDHIRGWVRIPVREVADRRPRSDPRPGGVGMDIRRVRIIAWWIAMNLVIVALAVHTLGNAASPPRFDQLLRSGPYLGMFTEANDSQAIRSANQLTGDAS